MFGKEWRSPLARALGIDRTTVWRYENGKRSIPQVVVLALTTLAAEPREK
jgi:transcriptional regulator with XRE-family HTH domain